MTTAIYVCSFSSGLDELIDFLGYCIFQKLMAAWGRGEFA